MLRGFKIQKHFESKRIYYSHKKYDLSGLNVQRHI